MAVACVSVESKESVRLVEKAYRALKEAGRRRTLTGRTYIYSPYPLMN